MANELNDGGPAYPHLHSTCQRINQSEYYEGLTVRDYFAGQALVGFLADSAQRAINESIKSSPEGKHVADTQALTAIVNSLLASGCYELADAMIAARAKPQPEE